MRLLRFFGGSFEKTRGVTLSKTGPAAGGLAQSAAFFQEVAHEYTSWYHLRTPGGHALRERQARVLRLLDAPTGRVLDVGCGPGLLVRELRARGHDAWGVDAAPSMIDVCRGWDASDSHRFVVGDLANLAFADEAFDTVACLGVLDRAPSLPEAIRGLARITRPNGQVIVSLPNRQSPYALWKKHVYYPAVDRFRLVLDRAAHRHVRARLSPSSVTLWTVNEALDVFAELGLAVECVDYYWFNPLLSPLDDVFPRASCQIVERLERLRGGPLEWIAAGFIVGARKREARRSWMK